MHLTHGRFSASQGGICFHQMGKGRGIIVALWLLIGAAAALGLCVGCGDNRPKIRRPEHPTPPPDESMKLHFEAPQAPAPQQTKKPTAIAQ
jgi:hypothetical protein